MDTSKHVVQMIRHKNGCITENKNLLELVGMIVECFVKHLLSSFWIYIILKYTYFY